MGTQFVENKAGRDGGAISLSFQAEFQSVMFSQNTASTSNGGAIYMKSANCIMRDSDFNGNYAKLAGIFVNFTFSIGLSFNFVTGGAIWGENSATAINNSRFIVNNAGNQSYIFIIIIILTFIK